MNILLILGIVFSVLTVMTAIWQLLTATKNIHRILSGTFLIWCGLFVLLMLANVFQQDLYLDILLTCLLFVLLALMAISNTFANSSSTMDN